MNSVASQLVRKQLSCCGSRSLTSFSKFSDYLSARRQQATKSLLIQVTNLNSAREVKSYLQNTFGPLEAVFHYSIPKKKHSPGVDGGGADNHWLLAEFSSRRCAEECLNSSHYPDGTLPFKSSMLWCRDTSSTKHSSRTRGHHVRGSEEVNGNAEDDVEELPKLISERLDVAQSPDFKKGKSLSRQLTILEESTKLTELGIRVRFFLASQLEKAFSNVFPMGCVLPFGSTVSGIGRQAGDLDLVLLHDVTEILSVPQRKREDRGGGRKQLHFQSKLVTAPNSSNARFQAQRVMEMMADMIQLFVPGCTHVQRILQARVPILRFWSDFTDLQCDLSMTNASGVHMSELVYLMCHLEPKFPTLLFAIRSWASARKLTNPVPGRQPTNFMFVLLLIYFLQQRQLLPTFDILFNNAGTLDHRMTTDGIDCSFLRDTEQILKYFTPHSGASTESTAELLFHFFEFYSEFDFVSKGISLITGTSWGKPDAGPLYIQNPLERHLNVSRNVSKEEVSRFKSECCSVLWKLETSWNSIHHSDAKRNSYHDSTASSNSSLSSITLKDLLLTPMLERSSQGGIPGGRNESTIDQRLQMKELFTK